MYAIKLSLAAGFLLSTVFAVIQAQVPLFHPSGDPQLNITSQTQDYINENYRQYNNNIINYEWQIDEFKSKFELQLKLLEKINAYTKAKFQEAHEKLEPLLVLSPLTKHCVQRHSWRISDGTVLSKLKDCVDNARGYTNSLISSCDSSRRTLITYYTVTLDRALNNCKSNSKKSNLNYTMCVTKEISAANAYTINNRKTFATNLEQSLCSADTRVKVASDCVYALTYDITSSIGQTMRSIEDCIAGEPSHQICQQSCPHVVNLALDMWYFVNETIRNPFYGVSQTSSKCLQVNFL